VENFIYQTQSVNLTRGNVAAGLRSVSSLLIHLMSKIAGRLKIGEDNVAVIRKQKLIKLVLISGFARDVKFHVG
jgi:hypothetical protein